MSSSTTSMRIVESAEARRPRRDCTGLQKTARRAAARRTPRIARQNA
jgi:hypothetical protein